MPLMKWARPTLRGMHAASRKLLVIPAHRGRFGLQVHAGLVLRQYRMRRRFVDPQHLVGAHAFLDDKSAAAPDSGSVKHAFGVAVQGMCGQCGCVVRPQEIRPDSPAGINQPVETTFVVVYPGTLGQRE